MTRQDVLRDRLFLLAPGFIGGGGKRQYCPECAEIWGFLGYFPAIREAVEIIYQPMNHPRADLVAALGKGEWNCPTLILAKGADADPDVKMREANGKRFFENARDIGKYFAHRYGTPFPR